MEHAADTTFSDASKINLLQLIAVDAALTVGLVAAFKIAGMSWGVALFAGWIGGAFLTIGVFFALAHFLLLREDRAPRWRPYIAERPVRPVELDLAQTVALWQDDLNSERAAWSEHAKALRLKRSRRLSSTNYHVAMWDADLHDDSTQRSARNG